MKATEQKLAELIRSFFEKRSFWNANKTLGKQL